MASQRMDIHRGDFIVNWAIPATGTLLPMGDDSSSTGLARPFSVQPIYGINHLSITISVPAGSTAVGTVTAQVSDFGGGTTPSTYDVFQTGFPWATYNQPYTTTPVTVAIASGAGTYNITIPNMGASYFRLVYTATSGTGTLNAALTGRAVGNA